MINDNLNPGSNYGKGGPGHIRLNIGSSRKLVKEALDQVAGAVNNAQSSDCLECCLDG